MTSRKRILFVAEAVTLAHVGRPIALAAGLDDVSYDTFFASAPRYRQFFPVPDDRFRPIHSIDNQQFLEALSKGRRVYDTDTLRCYVQDDLKVLRELQPDVVVGDFRLSLSVSARVLRIPYVTITNAYWSPYAQVRFPVPELPWVRLTGPAVGNLLFHLARPLAFAYHALPLNRVRADYGLSSLGPDLRKTYTDGDLVLYADTPALIRTAPLPQNHHFIGPILWSPRLALPAWWDRLPQDRPLIYLTLGSSGSSRLLPIVLATLAELPLSIVVATAGAPLTDDLPPNVFSAVYLPGENVVSHVQLVVCNGGSPTAYQALAAGVPVLGIASNLDQFLNMQAVETRGAGILMRADRIMAAELRKAVQAMLEAPEYTRSAQRLAQAIGRYPASERFSEHLMQLVKASSSS